MTAPHQLSHQPRPAFDFDATATDLSSRVIARGSIPDVNHVGLQQHIPLEEAAWEGAFYLGDAGARRGVAAGVRGPGLSYRDGNLGGLFFAVPMVSVDPRTWLPIGGLGLNPDDRWRPQASAGAPMFTACDGVPPVSVATPTGTKDPVRAPGSARVASAALPGGHPSIALRGAEERSQALLEMPSWAGVLVADHRGAEPRAFSSLLVDVDGAHYADGVGGRAHYAAGLDSGLQVARVWGPAADDACAVALWWARRARDDGAGRGLFASRGPFGALAGEVLGYASSDGGGPILAGPCTRHVVHVNGEGRVTTQGHLWLDAPWYVDPAHDAPPAFDRRVYEPAQLFGRPWAVLLRHDPESVHPVFGARGRGGVAQGRMRWQTYIPLWTPPDPPPEPPPLDDPLPPPLVPPPRGSGDGYALPGVVRHPDGSITAPDGRRFTPQGEEVIPLPEGYEGGYPPLPLPIPGTVAEEAPRVVYSAALKRGIARQVHLYAEAAQGAGAFIPRHSGGEDLRYELSPSDDQLRAGPGSAPPVLRYDVVGAQSGEGWLYSTRPGLARYRAGDGYGALVMMPPGWDVDYLDDDATAGATAQPAIASASALLLWGVRLGFGQVFRAGDAAGKVRLGYTFAEEGGELFLRHHDEGAAETVLMTVDSSGLLVTGNLRASSGAFGVFGGNLAAQASAIADASGGATQDAEARTAINALLAVMRSAGFVAP